MEGIYALRAALAAATQERRHLRLDTLLGARLGAVEAFSGIEQVDGAGFVLDVLVLSLEADLPLEQLYGTPALLQMQTTGAPRAFHGHVTAVERLGSNGGLARYRLRLQPWLAFLAQRVDSYVFHDRSVVEIVEDIFADYIGLVPAWRWALADRSQYARRSLTTQYQESDLGFLQRLLAEEGIYYWFEHAGDPGNARLGAHTLVLADHHGDVPRLGTVRFHRRDATERSDSVRHWRVARRWCPAAVSRQSWDHRTATLRHARAEVPAGVSGIGEDIDTSGPYGWQDSARGQRRAQQHLDALRVRAHTIEGQGSWRQLVPGAQFQLGQHPGVDAGTSFLCLSVQHQARNNLEADILDALEQQLGPVAQAPLALPVALAGLAAAAPAQAVTSTFYDNRFVVIPADVVYRPQTEDGHGVRLHPRPSITGTLSAIVVSDGEPLQSDRDHRIKVQFPWQRGGASSTGQAHPGGDDNAPANGGAWTWVRVMTPWAGDNWGGVVLPRRGQEVLVAFLEGDIDRPVVVGAVYNGRGQNDASHNQVASGGAQATGNAAAWFEGNDHGAVFTGFKSQALADSQGGAGGYQQLRLDDTPGQGRAQLSTTQHATTLTLGHLKGGEDNVREAERGFGAELSSQAFGALRAGKGLLLSTEGGEPQLAANQAMAQLQESTELVATLNESAHNQQAMLPQEPSELPAHQTLLQLQEKLGGIQSGGPAGSIQGGDGEAPGWDAPTLMGSGVAGVMSLTPADQVWVSGTQTTLASGVALNWLSQGSLTLAVSGGLVLYTAGNEAKADSPNTERGIALHAAQGKVSARAHKNVAQLAAKTAVKIASTEADVLVSAPAKHVLATAAGAYLRIEGDNIELGAPGKVEFKASQREWTDPDQETVDMDLADGQLGGCDAKDNADV
ncbi:hypothetical protein G9274_003666 [Stenotrophomonas rhizophila]|nr:hypothetical protein G9274_003666 [Stenotrophomonas rhizophila]